ncbi:MAG: hypothetical protein K6E40_11105 [Desulfovibrio sp.]|nr:hypothetical protein [Desulfovibrio sp.]
MSSNMLTLHEIAMKHAKKQPGIVDDLTEEAPILDRMKWKASTHGLWNVAEKLTDVTGPAFVKPDAPLPEMNVSSDLMHVDLNIMGGVMEVPSERARKLGGPMKYFADKQPTILKKCGMDTEIQIVKENWLKAAVKEKTLYDAGGSGKGWFILAVRFDPEVNVGLYDPQQFDSGRLLKITFPYGGEEHYLHTPGYEGVLGYSVVYRGNFGWQILDAKRTCAAIVNIDETHKPTPAMIDDMLATVRAQPGSTHLVTSHKGKIYGINPYKLEHVELSNGDTDAKTKIETWGGIDILTSYNLTEKIPHVAVPSA